MLTEIQSALSTINIMTALTKAVIGAKVDAALREQAIETQAAIIDIQTVILGLQSQHQALLREKDELEKRLIETENWEAEAQQYTLAEMVTGVFVYALKPDYKATAPPHWLCPNCYQDKKKSILQFEHRSIEIVFRCPRCGLLLHDHTNNAMPR